MPRRARALLPFTIALIAFGCGDDDALPPQDGGTEPQDGAADVRSNAQDANADVSSARTCETLANANGWTFCSGTETSCAIVFEDGTGCPAACRAIGLECEQSYDDVPNMCDYQRSAPPLGCASTGHASDYCVCGTQPVGDAGIDAMAPVDAAVSDASVADAPPFDAGPSTGELVAFPGAEGYGRNARGGRGGRVIRVTNLNDSGAGSFREACEATGPRIIIFDVGGRINLRSTVTISDPYVTIAGQHSVGDGITLSMEGTPNRPVLSIQTHDVIVRYLTIRRSENEVSERNSDCLVITDAHDVIVDHCSFSWASDENIAIYDYDGNNEANVYNITIQNSLIDTAWGGQDKGIIASGGIDRLSFYNLLFTSVGQRQPLIKNEEGNYATAETYFEIINTVTFEGKLHASFPNSVAEAGLKHLNYINNLCIDSSFSRNMLYVSTAYPVNIYTRGNISPLRTSITSPVDWDEEWSVIQPGGGASDVENTLDTAYRTTTPIDTPIVTGGVPLVDAVDLFDSLRDHVGASLPTRDSEDARAINDVVTRTATAPSTSGTFPIINGGTPLPLGDGDGMPDAWEASQGHDMGRDDSAEDADDDGYTNIEEFLNSF